MSHAAAFRRLFVVSERGALGPALDRWARPLRSLACAIHFSLPLEHLWRELGYAGARARWLVGGACTLLRFVRNRAHCLPHCASRWGMTPGAAPGAWAAFVGVPQPCMRRTRFMPTCVPSNSDKKDFY